MRTLKHFFAVHLMLLIAFTSYAQVSSFPYQEGFETDFGDWQQYATNDFDWERNSGGTSVFGTGPNAAYEGDWYAYAQAENHNNQSAGLFAIFNFNSAGLSDINLVFSYHMYCFRLLGLFPPDQMGTLNVYVSTDGGVSWNNEWSLSGNQGNNWNRARLDLSAYTSYDDVYIGFQAQIGNGNRSDIAIDDIQIFETPPCTTVPYLETFDGSSTLPFGWFCENLWFVNDTWPGSDPITGNSVRTLDNSTGNDILYPICFDVSSNSNIHVRFYHYWEAATFGNQNGYFYGSPDGGTTTYLIDEWDNNLAEEEAWKEYDISSWADGAGDLTFWWEVDRTGFICWGGVWAFDHFEVKEGDWNYLWTGNTNTDWNIASNWEDNTIPDTYSDATIPTTPAGGNFPEVNTGNSANCRDLFIEAGSHLNIAPNTDLTVHNSLTNYGDASALVIDADVTGMGSIIHNTQFVQGTVEQYITSERWHLVSSPISDAIINTYYDIYLKEYSEPTDTWSYLVNPVTMPMNVRQGYSAWASDIYTGTTISLFPGTLNVEDVVINNLSFTTGAPMIGFNLIGNPYPCAIDWNMGWPSANISGWAVIYDNGTYRGWNPYLTGNNRSYNGKLDGIIPATNGFWVRATGTPASLTLPASERVHSNQPFYKEAEESTNGSVRLVARANDWMDEAVVVFHEEGTPGFDGLYDLEKLYNVSESPQIYTISENKNYSVNVHDQLSGNLVIPVGYEMSISGDYTIEASEIQNIGNEYNIFLEDILSGEIVDLRRDPVYNFYFSPDDNKHRFNVHFSKSAIDISETSEDLIKIYSNDKNVFISLDQSADCDVQIIDLTGKQVGQYFYPNLKGTTLILNVKRGYYVVRVITTETVVSEKVFIK